jgi:hypothetical protein
MALLDSEVRTPAPRTVTRPRVHRQIADLERSLAAGAVDGFPARRPVSHVPADSDGPRVLGRTQLERIRDRMADTLAGVPVREAQARLEEMRADPPAHRGERVTLAELGLGGCSFYVVRPRLGTIGRLMGWWRVKLSSGCPSAAAAGGR